jgi:uncharacterized HhH-GPD family protein
MDSQVRVARRLLKYGESLGGGWYTKHSTANRFVSNNATALLLAVIFDQGIPYEKAWEAPYKLKRRLGHLDVRRLARMPIGQLRKAVRGKGDGEALHRFVGKLPRWIKKACGQIVKEYGGDPSQIWEECFSAGEVIERLDDLPGIGQKKAHMTARIIHEDWWRLRRWNEINVAVDVHVQRVWKRTGLVQNTSPDVIMQKAIELNPDYPGDLDYPTWMIGMEWCHPRNPACAGPGESVEGPCPLRESCPKIGVRGAARR